MTYEESAALMTDATFRGRVKTACLKFASSIMSEPTVTPAHNARSRWAGNCYMNPENTAGQVTPPVCLDPNVQTSGAAIDDNTLQGAVEATVMQMI